MRLPILVFLSLRVSSSQPLEITGMAEHDRDSQLYDIYIDKGEGKKCREHVIANFLRNFYAYFSHDKKILLF